MIKVIKKITANFFDVWVIKIIAFSIITMLLYAAFEFLFKDLLFQSANSLMTALITGRTMSGETLMTILKISFVLAVFMQLTENLFMLVFNLKNED